MNSAAINIGDVATASQYNNVRKDVIQLGGDYAVTTGSSNTYVLALDSAFVLSAGVAVKFKANFTNTASATLNVNSSGAKTLKKKGTNNLISGDIISGNQYIALYDGTNWQVLNISSSGKFGDKSDGDFHATVDTTLNPSYKIFQYGNFVVDSGKTLDFGSNFQGKPIVILVDGDLTLNDATVNVNNMGALGGTSDPSGAAANGTLSGSAFNNVNGRGGVRGFYNGTASLATGGTAGAASDTQAGSGFFTNLQLYKMVHVGSGGGAGAYGVKVGQVSGNTGGAGGNGGGGILFLVSGNIDVTNAILTANGQNGTNGNQADNTYSGSGAGGGGEGGSFRIGYIGTKTGSPTTHTATKGNGGTCSHIANGGVNGGGGGGGSGAGSGIAGTAGETANVGIGGGNGSAGADGYTEITQLLPSF